MRSGGRTSRHGLRLRVRARGGTATVALSGALDLHAARRVEEVWDKLSARQVVVRPPANVRHRFDVLGATEQMRMVEEPP